MSNATVTPARDGSLILEAGSFGAKVSAEQAQSLWAALTLHFLTNPNEGSEFAVSPVPAKPVPTSDLREYRPGDKFPDVGYVRYMSALSKVPA